MVDAIVIIYPVLVITDVFVADVVSGNVLVGIIGDFIVGVTVVVVAGIAYLLPPLFDYTINCLNYR